MTTIYDFSAQRLDGREVDLGEWRGDVVVIVNTASKCGFTPQYEGLELLQKRFAGRGFAVLGFPCNQFGAQEPGDGVAIRGFCEANYGVTFPMFAKVDVKGENAHPLFRHLATARPGVLGLPGIKWNFTKFLVDRGGGVVARFAPITKPAAMASTIEALL